MKTMLLLLLFLTLFYIPDSGGSGVALPFNLTFICWLGLVVMVLAWRHNKGGAERQPLLLAGGLLLTERRARGITAVLITAGLGVLAFVLALNQSRAGAIGAVVVIAVLCAVAGRGKASRAGRRCTLLVAALLLVPCGIIREAAANTGDQFSMNINITGTIQANGRCMFNHGGALQVDFGQVRLKATGATTVQLDGSYEQPLAASFTCSGDSAGLLQMKFTSSSGSYETYNGTKVLGTDKGILGIELMVNGTAQTMDAWFSIDQKNPPALRAKLVQVSTENSKNVVSGDVFTASGSLVMAFN